ncbi:MAG: NAD-dependent deacylase [Desulfobacterota bacterium]|nr:NAD-dependent deacylase [Thermodesulfobacteriota bacterium]
MYTDASIERLARDIVASKKTVALSGAGMSVESGIPTFRGKGGLWEKYNPEEYGHITTLRYHPERAWIMLKDMQLAILPAKPNAGHYALAELEALGLLSSIITQNVDGLHHVAGSKNVIEFHGNLQTTSCMDCGFQQPSSAVPLDTIPPRCPKCNGPVKPDAVFFGEAIPLDALTRSHQEAQSCELMLVIGTEAVVYPAASMPEIARSAGAKVVEINPSRTPLTDFICTYSIHGPAGEVLAKVVGKVKELRKG